MSLNRVFLAGFMTSGKSTIGPIVANVIGWNFFDLDKVIENDMNLSVVEIFQIYGEEYFRNIERETLMRLSEKENIVVALGGGTIRNQETFDLVKSSGRIIYLKVSPAIIYRRIKNKIDRPLFRDLTLEEQPEDQFISRINYYLQQREEFYNKSDFIISTEEKKIGLTVDLIAKKIYEWIHYDNSR